MAAKKINAARNDRLGGATGERVEEKSTPAVAFYHACSCCTAKWFSVRHTLRCPRCGCDQVNVTVERLPWRCSD